MSYQSVIESKIFKKKAVSSFDSYIDHLYLLAKEFGWTPQQVNEIPIPIINALIVKINDYYKAQNKANKKR